MLEELFVGKPKVNVRLQIALDVKRRTMFFANFAAQTALDASFLHLMYLKEALLLVLLNVFNIYIKRYLGNAHMETTHFKKGLPLDRVRLIDW